jgi:hypothetical protein
MPGQGNFNHVEQRKHLVAWKKEKDTIWLSEVPCKPLQQTLKELRQGLWQLF